MIEVEPIEQPVYYQTDAGEMMRNLNITVNVKDTIALLQKNMEQHIEVHEKAHKAWQEAVAKACHEVSVRASDGVLKRFPRNFGDLLREPRNHREEYEKLIAVLGGHVAETIEMEANVYAKIVTNDFSWRREWREEMTSYLGDEID